MCVHVCVNCKFTVCLCVCVCRGEGEFLSYNFLQVIPGYLAMAMLKVQWDTVGVASHLVLKLTRLSMHFTRSLQPYLLTPVDFSKPSPEPELVFGMFVH